MVLGHCVVDKQGWILRVNGFFVPGELDGSTKIFKDRECLEHYINKYFQTRTDLVIKKVVARDLSENNI